MSLKLLVSLTSFSSVASSKSNSFSTTLTRLTSNAIVSFGNTKLKVLETPGHSPGSLSFYNAENGILFSGDVLFYQGVGRTDLPGGSYEILDNTIRNKLFLLPSNTIVFCGHGPKTTIGTEKENYSLW
jgi:glyoxylase-like metal-dependent hydrolase (beta-lactamase superfamily II)